MRCVLAGCTDKGKRKKINQDAILLRGAGTMGGQKAVLAVVCDGMGGFAQGEFASKEMVRLFSEWLDGEFRKLGAEGDMDEFEDALYESWEELFQSAHQKIREYGKVHEIKIGTTATAILFVKERYYIAHIGDSGAYEIKNDSSRQLTQDQNMANVNPGEQQYLTRTGEKKKPSSVLIQGIGASRAVCPVYDSGEMERDAVYLLCSDGFKNRLAEGELTGRFGPGVLKTKKSMDSAMETFIKVLRERGEKDDITVLLIRTMEVQD